MASLLTKPDTSLYERDFYAWTQQQAEKLRVRSHNDIDWEIVAEEIESLGRSDKREIRSRIGVIVTHLLKWEFQPDKRKLGWLSTLIEQRERVEDLLAESPSLASLAEEATGQVYPLARRKAATETQLLIGTFPKECPYPPQDVLSQDFYPGVPWSRSDLYSE